MLSTSHRRDTGLHSALTSPCSNVQDSLRIIADWRQIILIAKTEIVLVVVHVQAIQLIVINWEMIFYSLVSIMVLTNRLDCAK